MSSPWEMKPLDEHSSREEFQAHLQHVARLDKADRIHIDRMEKEHLEILERAISNVLDTDIALSTYAQLIDGLPTADAVFDTRIQTLPAGHPLDEEECHEELCPGMLDKARAFKENDFDLAMLFFDPKTVRAYEKSTINDAVFVTRLIELVAVAVHQIGVLLAQLDLRMHQGPPGDIDRMREWAPPDNPTDSEGNKWYPAASLFIHPMYQEHLVYPDGVADLAGYWAEDRILGGVILFDRKSEKPTPQCPPRVYSHSARQRRTNLVWQLREEQQTDFVEFLLSSPDETTGQGRASPLPILPDDENTVRIVDWDSIVHHGIYRDIWERVPLDEFQRQKMQGRPKSSLDYPELRVLMYTVNGMTPPEAKKTTDASDSIAESKEDAHKEEEEGT